MSEGTFFITLADHIDTHAKLDAPRKQ